MALIKPLALAGAGIAAALTVAAAQQPSVLGRAQPGLWEISGAAGMTAPVTQCVTQVALLAEFEHRGKTCQPKVISDGASSTVIEYSCGPAGFGHSKVDFLTPRSLRIETQGISNQLPFRHVLQARRVGDCQNQASASRH